MPSTKARGGAIFCEKNWTVKSNELYNIRGYNGLNICWVYNYLGESWRDGLPNEIKAWLKPSDPKNLSKQAKDLQHFPVLQDVRREPDERDQAEAAAGEPAGRSRGVVDQQQAGG